MRILLKGKLTLEVGSEAQFLNIRLMPEAFKPKLEKELWTLQNEGILTKVEGSEWATQNVPVPATSHQRKCKQFWKRLAHAM